MNEDVRAMLILQDRDRRLLALDRDLAKLPHDQSRAKAKLAGDIEAVTKAHQRLIEDEIRVKKIELDAQTRRTTIARLKDQQFETRKNEEFVALGHEITRYEKELDDLETKELEAMEVVDASRAAQTQAEAKLARTRSLVDEDLASLAERQERMTQDRIEVIAERDKAKAVVSEDLLPLYQKLMKSKDGLALSPMRGSICEGCHMTLIASTIVAVNGSKEPARCENCGRFLYLEES